MDVWIFQVALTICLVGITSADPKTVINIGGVLSSRKIEQSFQRYVEELNTDPETRMSRYIYNATTLIMHQNPIRSALQICDNLLPKKVYAVVVSHPPGNRYPAPISVSYTCGFYMIPVIGISARDSVFSDTNLHVSYLRTVPPYSHQAKVWVDLVRHFKWSTVVIFHSADQEGRAMVATFQNEIDSKEGLARPTKQASDIELKIEIAKVIDYSPGEDSYVDKLRPRFDDDTQVFLLSASKEDATTFFNDIVALNMTGPGYVWILSEQALEAENAPSGGLGMMLRNSRNEDFHIRDSVKIIGKAFKKALSHNNMTEPPSMCSATSNWNRHGEMLYHYLVTSEIEDGFTGKVKFSEAGDRLLPVYDITNIQGKTREVVGSYGATDYGALLHVDDSSIIWPGNLTTKPEGYRMSTHLRVVTIHSIPFVFTRKVDDQEECGVTEDEIYCPWPNFTEPGNETPYCCKGYAIDMLKIMAASENFTFDIHLVEDGLYGSLDIHNGSSQREWNGMMGEVLKNKADLIVAPMTIDPDRALYVEFTKPFKYQGLTILVRKQEKNSNLGSFLQPFQDTLWILVGLSVHVVALVLYLLDRFSPFGRFKLAKNSDTEEDALNLSSAMWFAWGVLLNSGIGEGTPRSFSARVLGMVWAGFAMIIVASYTANLAAFLVLDRPEASITGIDDARLRNPQKDFTYGSVKGSSVLEYFKRRVELSTMYRTMEDYNTNTAEEAIEKVKSRKLNAFIWDSTRLDYEAYKDCDLVTVGELFGRSGFGIGLRLKSPWVNRMSLKLLNMHERGAMEELDTRWILVEPTSKECAERDHSPATLGLTNMAGVFMLVAGGIIAGVFLIFIEIAYKRHRGMKEKELELARNAADRWRGNIEKRKTLRRTILENPTYSNSDLRPNGRTSNLTKRGGLQSRSKSIEGELAGGSGYQPGNTYDYPDIHIHA